MVEQKNISPIENSHYKTGTKQPVEIMQEIMSTAEFRGFLWGNIIKYALRLGKKDAISKEAGKIEEYARWLKEFDRDGKINVS